MVVDEGTRNEDLVHEIEPQLQQELLKHPGKWAAITRSKILAIGDDPRKVVAAARKMGIAAPILYRIPDASTLYFY
jgi:hypothetical protein